MLSAAPTRIVTIGDSLTDSGTTFDLTDTMLRGDLSVPVRAAYLPGPAFAGVFSNGPVHPQVMARIFGLDPDGDVFGYATGSGRLVGVRFLGDQVGGAEDLVALPPDDPLLRFDMSTGAQVDRFLDGAPPSPNAAAPDLADTEAVTLAILFAGLLDASDVADVAADGGFFEVSAAVLSVQTAARQRAADLAGSGLVDHLALYALPSPEVFPDGNGLSPDEAAAANIGIDLFNTALSQTAEAVARETGIGSTFVRLDLFLTEIDADPATFGFAAKGPVYLQDGVPRPDQLIFDTTGDVVAVDFPLNPDPAIAALPLDVIEFIDPLHFSAALHAAVGAFGARSLTHRARFEGEGDDRLVSFVGDDLVFGQDGADALYLGLGDDIAFGGLGDDAIRGAAGSDMLVGGAGADQVRGGSGDDLLAGSAGDDGVRGGAGDDTLLDGAGADVVHGGAGADVMIWVDPGPDAPGGGDRFDGGAGVDVLYLVTDRTVETGGRGLFDVLLGRWDLSDIGVTAYEVERVEVLSPEAYASGTGVRVTVPDLVAEADLWGVV
jgi:hypothetical protein